MLPPSSLGFGPERGFYGSLGLGPSYSLFENIQEGNESNPQAKAQPTRESHVTPDPSAFSASATRKRRSSGVVEGNVSRNCVGPRIRAVFCEF